MRFMVYACLLAGYFFHKKVIEPTIIEALEADPAPPKWEDLEHVISLTLPRFQDGHWHNVRRVVYYCEPHQMLYSFEFPRWISV